MRLLSPSSRYALSLIVSLLLVQFNSVRAQESWVPGDYFGIPSRDKHDVFFDEFEDNRSKWDLGSMYLDERIQDGDYYCASLTSHVYDKHRPVNLSPMGNYEVEIRLRYVKGTDRSETGMIFGRDIRGNEFGFIYNPQNPRSRFKITKSHQGRHLDLLTWKYFGDRYNKHAFNTLMVRKVGSQWYFFINEVLVHKGKAQALFGKNFGFTVGGNTAVEVDYVRVSEIRTVDNMGPQITILEPQLSGSEVLKFNDRRQIIRGKVHDVSGVNSLTINNYPITISEDGIFTASLKLRDDRVYTIEVQAKDKFNNLSKANFSMQYASAQPPVYRPVLPSPRPASSAYAQGEYPSNATTRGGKNYLLLIGVNQYESWNRLHNAVKDCNDLAYTLTSYYQFDPKNVITLFNDEATRENILETFESLQETVSEDDNLLIYYAGHGYYDPQSTLGYWVPVNARLNKIPDFIRNSTIHDYLRTINSKHTLLIADACYAGSLFSQSRGIINRNNRSRWAFTSGDIEKVWDGQPGQNSPFARYLIRCLRNNTKPELEANELINEVRLLVQRNTAQTPRGDALRSVGDEGGIFTFVKR